MPLNANNSVILEHMQQTQERGHLINHQLQSANVTESTRHHHGTVAFQNNSRSEIKLE